MEKYQISEACGVPIYRQLVEALRSDIKRGVLPYGTKLETVRDLADRLCVARGTVKRAYDELDREGLIEMSRGCGTFVAYEKPSERSRKELAIEAIDTMLDRLEELDFSLEESQIFIDLKLRERKARSVGIQLALVECNREILGQITKQVQRICQAEIHPLLLEEVARYPFRIGDDTDLVITTPTHAPQLQQLLNGRCKVAKAALTVHPRTAVQIASMRAVQTVGLLCESDRFAGLVERILELYAPGDGCSCVKVLLSQFDAEKQKLAACDMLLAPQGYEGLCSEEVVGFVENFARREKLVLCEYQIDQGSEITLRDRVDEIRVQKGMI